LPTRSSAIMAASNASSSRVSTFISDAELGELHV
jgi:hypothetical protein